MDLLAQMATFVRVVEGGSLSSAARAQRMSLAAISRQLRSLEDDLGASLVARSTRRLRITDAGRDWYAHCVRILRDVDDARTSLSNDRRVAGRLVVSASIALGTQLVVPKIPALLARHPLLQVDLRLEDQLVDLVGEGIDVAVRGGVAPPDTTAFVAHPIERFHRVLVATPGYLKKRRPAKPEDLLRHVCLVQLATQRPVVPWTLVRGDTSTTVEVRGAVRASTPMALRELTLAGIGIAFLPTIIVGEDLAKKRLVRVLDGWSSAEIGSWAIHRTELRGSPKVKAFLEALVTSKSRR